MTSETFFSENASPALNIRAQKKAVFHFEFRSGLPVFICLCVFSLIGIFQTLFTLITQKMTTYAGIQPSTILNNPAFDFTDQNLLSYSFSLSIWDALIFPLAGYLLALIQFSYLFKRNELDVYGALPVSRSAFFAGKMRAGMLILILPITVRLTCEYLMNILMVGFTGLLTLDWLLSLLTEILLFALAYLLTVLVSVQVGTFIENIFFPFILIFAPIILYVLAVGISDEAIIGCAVSNSGLEEFLFPYLIPLSFTNFGIGLTNTMLENILYDETAYTGPLHALISMAGGDMIALLIWIVITLLCFWGARTLFLRRNLEIAGVRGITAKMNLVTLWLMEIGTSMLAYSIFGLFTSFSISVPGLCLAVAVLFITLILFQLIVYQKLNWKPAFLVWAMGIPVLLLTLFFTYCGTMGFGSYLKTPDLSSIDCAYISYTGIEGYAYNYENSPFSEDPSVALTSEEGIQDVICFQSDLLEAFEENHSSIQNEEENWTDIKICYERKDGRKIFRSYSFSIGLAYDDLLKLESCEEFCKETTSAFLTDWNDLYKGRLCSADLTRNVSLNTDAQILQKAYQESLMAHRTCEELKNPTESPICYLAFTDISNTEEYYFPVYESDTDLLNLLSDDLSLLNQQDTPNSEAYLIDITEDNLGELLCDYSINLNGKLFFSTPEDSYYYLNWEDLTEENGDIKNCSTLITDPNEIQDVLAEGKTCGIMSPGDQLLLIQTDDGHVLPLLLSNS